MLLAFLTLAVLAKPAISAPGDLDASFGDAGLVTENVGTVDGRFRGEAVLRQPDGKLIVGGSTESDSQFVIARYATNGSLDSSFGGGDGVTIVSVGSYLSNLADMALQGDGKIVAVGSAYGNFGVLRLNSDGSPDTGFGEDGVVTTDFDSNVDTANAVVIAGDGDIIVGGSARFGSNDDFAVARYLSDGSLDSTFDGDGKATTDFPAGFRDKILGMALQVDGKIVASGGAGGEFGLARYTSTGALDSSFDTDGLLTTDFGGSDEANDVAVAATGEITAVGRGNGDLAVARYESDGTLDASFDGDGKVSTDQENVGGATGVVLSGGKTIVSASANSGGFDFALARFNSDGGLDTDGDGDPGVDLGGDGIVQTEINGGNDFANDLVEQADGKLVVVGVASSGTLNSRFGLVRFETDGSLDNSFDDNGIATSAFQVPSDDAGYASASTPDGKLVVVGETNDVGLQLDFLVMRFNADGSLDTTFDGDGIAVTDLGGADSARAVAVQPDGKILVGGSSNAGFNKDFAVVRYNTDGSLDTDSDADPGSDFGLVGFVTEDLGGADTVKALAVEPNGKVVAAGIGPSGFGLARFDEFGDLDTAFDDDGIVETDFGGVSNTSATALLVTGEAIVAAGAAGFDFALARYNRSDGSLDTTFDGDGTVRTDFSAGSDGAESVAIQADGKLVAAGWSNSLGAGGIDFALSRYNADGSLDTGFDGDGLVTASFSPEAEERALGVAVQGDGKILAGGSTGTGSQGLLPASFALARFESNGSLDGSFGTGGKVTSDFGSSSRALNLTLMPDGDVVLAGGKFNGPEDLAAARYEGDGGAVPTRTLTVTTGGDGSGTVTGPGIACPGDCTEDFALGTVVSLSASPTGNSSFDGWGGDCAGDGQCSLTMSADRQVSANFGAPSGPDFGTPVEVDNVDAFDLRLTTNAKGVVQATVFASQAGRVVANAFARVKGKKKKFSVAKQGVKPNRSTRLSLKPKAATRKLLKKSKRPLKVSVTVKYKPDAGNQTYRQREIIKTQLGETKAIARWVEVAVGTVTTYRLDSDRGIVVRGSVDYGQVKPMVPVNARVPAKLRSLAVSACKKRGRPFIELLLQAPDGNISLGGGLTGRPGRTTFSSLTNFENNVWPRVGDDSSDWAVLVRSGWPRLDGGFSGTRTVRTEFKGRNRSVFCTGTQGSFPHPFVPDRD